MQRTIDNYVRLTTPALLLLCTAAMLHAQSFPSGSTGADGPLNITAPGVTTFTQAPVGGGSIYNFTTITIAAGSTLKLSGAVFPGPLFFLAQGAVTVAGTVDLSGQTGSVPTNSAQRTGPTVPGAGGYGGGSASFGADPALPGLGPSGGATSGTNCYGAQGATGGSFSGNQFLVPLVGGSGGGGYSGSGGAGGGALLIASSVSVTVNGTITANGGNGASGSGGGAGGGVRLVAPTIAGTGAVTAAGGPASIGAGISCGSTNPGASGVVRLESFQSTFTGSTGGNLYTATPINLFIPTAIPSIMVTSIGGVAVPSNPTGSFTVPDVLLNSSSPLTVSIKAANIPLGTIPTVYFSTQNFPDQKIAATGLTGSLASSTATATVTLNSGFSIGYVIATFTQ